MIVWVNGAFGSGKSTLAEELRARMPDAVVFDPEYVGYIITQWVPAPTGDFQDLPIWRHLVIETALALRKFHAEVLIVPMTLVDERYYGEVVGGLCGTGEQVAHAFRLKNIDRCVAAAARQPADTLMLRSDLQTPAQLADAVMAHLT